MPVNNYLKDICKYSLNNLDNYIYLYTFDEPILNFITDDGENNATATSIKGSSQRLYCNSVQYQSTTSIDNRFAFDNTLTVTLSEHSKVSHYSIIQTLLNGNWMVVFKNTDGDAFVVNAEYPVMVSYSYVINDEKTPNNLTITFRALQNVPTVNLKGSVAFSSTLCDNYCEYNISRIETLKMIDMNKATIDVNNNGFSLTEIGEGNLKTIEFNPTSMSFTDSFDGREFSQTLTFQIPFDSYRYYFHYNLLEFLDNRYYALIKTTDDNNILGGFRQGLFPSYTISTADNSNVITITLNAKYTNYSVLGSDTMSTTTNDGMFYKPVMGECVDKLYVWTLIEQYNANGVATNGYYCLSGFEDIYNDYTILGTYDKYDTRFGFKLIDYNIDCSEGCKINNLPSSIQFENSGETKCYTLDTTCSIVWEWNSTAIDFTYDEITKEMCVTSKVDEGTFNIKATTTDGTIQYATVVIGNGGITGDTTTTINITAEGQRVTVIPVKGMSNVKSLTSSLQYQVNQNGNGYEVTVPENTREETKTYTITILYKDNSIETVSIIQERIYYIITSSEETECYGQNLYYVDKKYKKYTENGELIFVENIKGNQKETDSVICLDFDEKVSGCTNCFEGFVYTLYEYKKNGSTIATRYEKTTSSCTNNASTEYVVNTEKAKCVDGTEYYVEEMYGANCNGGNNVKLYPVIERTSIVEATDSNVCDVIDPNASGGTLYRWVDTNETYCLTNTAQTNCTSSTTNTYCDGYNLFEQTTYYVDALCNGNWVQSGNTQTILKEENSTICGYVNPDTSDTLSFNSIATPTTYILNGNTYTATTKQYTTTLDDLGIETLTSCNSTFLDSNITELISFPDTSSVTHMGWMFSNCKYLTSLDLSSFNTSNVTHMISTFSKCSGLTSLNLSSFNTSNVTTMSNMFFKCSSLPSLDLSSFNTSNVTSMSGMFSFCTNLTTLDLSNFNTSGVTDMTSMFGNCSGLTSLNLSSFNTSNVTHMDMMFSGCTSLTTLDLSNFDTNNLLYVQYMFDGCSGLTSLNLSSFDTSNVLYMYYMFRNCTSLTELDLSNFNTSVVTNMIGIFNNCKSLQTLDVSSWDISKVTSYSNMFTNCTSLQTLKVKEGTRAWWCDRLSEAGLSCDIIEEDGGSTSGNTLSFEFSGDAATYKLNGTRYTATTSPYTTTLDDLGIETLTSCYGTFSGSSITELTSFPDTSNATSMSKMFYNCYSLTTLDVSNFDTSNVTDMSDMFIFCSGLTELNVSNFNTSNVTDMSYMFNDCKSLTTLNVSNFNTSNVTDMNWMFKNCSGLTELNVSNFNTSNATSMSNMFTNCKSLTSLDVSNFNTSNVTDMEFMFSNCESLTSLDVSNFNTSNVTDMRVMFQFCSSLTELDLSNFDTSKVTDMSTMFNGCKSLQYLDVSSFDISKVTTYDNMFRYCTKLQTLKVKEGTYEWWCDRLQEAGLSCDIIEEDGGSTSGDTLSFEFSGDAATYKLNGTRYTATTSPYTIEVTDLTNCDDTFNGSSITNLISFPDTSNVTKMRYMFRLCSGLTSLDLTSFNTSNVDDMNDMFSDCTKLTSLNISSFNTSKVTDMSNMFYKCMILSTLDVSNFNTTNVQSMTTMFCYCENLTSLDLSSFNTSNLKYMSWMFEDCKSLQILDVSSWDVGDHIINKNGVFNNCTSLRTLRIKQGTRAWWCDRLSEAGISCDIIEEDRGNAGGGIVDAE